ncbi:22602_t:CDS:2, partial [Dentiscutata erythropus]
NMTKLDNLMPEEFRMADGLFCIDWQILPKIKSWEGLKIFDQQLMKILICLQVTFNQILEWQTKEPFNLKNLNENSTIVSFIASHWTDFRKDWVPKLQAYIYIASFGKVHHNTDWDIHSECATFKRNTMYYFEDFNAKNCIISKYPFYLAIENLQEKNYSSKKLWDLFKLGAVLII